jgi:DNA-binding transcriptional ArsR family regulator
MAELRDLLISRVRVKLLQQFLIKPQEMYYVRQLVRLTGEEINAVRRELSRLENLGLLTKEPRANRLYYSFNRHYPFYQDLLSLTAKTTGLGAEIVKHQHALGSLKFALLSGRFARKMPRKSSEDIDLLVVGNIKAPQLNQLVRKAEASGETEINYAPMSVEEFEFRKKRRDPFLLKILMAGRVMLIGDEEEMVG